MSLTIRSTSRLNFAMLKEIGGVECWEMPEHPTIDAAQDDIIYTVKRTDRVDILAKNFYGAPDLWWVLAIANNVSLVPNGFYENQVIRVPSPSRVFTKILKRAPRYRSGR